MKVESSTCWQVCDENEINERKKRVGCFKQTKDCVEGMNCSSKDACVTTFILCVAAVIAKLCGLCGIV